MATLAGDMRERVTVQRATASADGYGGQNVSWADVATMWAKVQPVKGTEGVQAGGVAALETYLVTVRYGADVSELDRLSWRSKTMNIRTAQDRERNRQWLTLECEVGVAI